MELMEKQKYKQTEIGLIPEDWKEVSMREITTLMTNGFVGTATSHYSEEIDSVLYIQGYNVKENSFNFKGIKHVNQDFHKKNKKSSLLEGDLLTVQTGDVGLTTIVPKQLEGSNCHALIISRFNKKIAYPWFYSQYFNSKQGRSRLKELETGTTMKHINVGELVHWLVPLPSTLEEQKAIATALSDADVLISNLDKLIAKKKAIKQGAMQQLLTPPHKGGKRLEEFTGEWEEKRLGDVIIDFQNGYSFSASGYKDEGIPIVTMAQIGLNGQFQYDENKVNYWSIEELKNLKSFTLYKGDVIMSMTDVTPEKNLIGRMTIVNELGPLYLNQRVGHLRINKNLVNPIILIHLSNMRSWRTYSKSIASLGVQANIGTTDIKNGLLWLPKIEEQNAIAEILSDMDLEIEQLESKKAKYQSVKQGMMQELLTGKTRLI